jgi:outer membrane lipoprotein-sorting protein
VEVITTLLLSLSLLFAHDPLRVLRERYDGILTLDARFRQRIYMPNLKKERELEGRFLYKKGKGFLWKYERPEERLYLFDGSFLWEDYRDRPYVVREQVTEERKRGTFFDLIEDIRRLEEFFELEASYGTDTGRTIELLPKKKGALQRVKLYLDQEGMVRKVEMEEIGGARNVIEFSSIKENRPVKDSLFVFDPGTKEVRGRP